MSKLHLDYVPRPQFVPFHKRKQSQALLVTHRGAGKTTACVNELQDSALTGGIHNAKLEGALFGYVAPFLSQAKAVAWNHLCTAAAPVAKAFPNRTTKNESELRWDYPTGARVRLFGGDNVDILRGLHFNGIVLDEFADHDPRLYSEIIQPALIQRNGWLVIIGTPRGKNAFYRMYAGDPDGNWIGAKNMPDWYTLVLKASETGLISPDRLAMARATMTPAQYEQEFECSFDALVKGAYYADLIKTIEDEKRVGTLPYDSSARVWTSWDLGMRDHTAIWFAQVCGREVHIIDYYERGGVSLADHVRELQKRPYIYAGHILPHDVEAREQGTGKSRKEVLEALGLTVTKAPNVSVQDGIEAVRLLLPKCWFDFAKTRRGFEAMKLYRADYDEKNEVLRGHAVRDWTTHPADSFRYLALVLDTRPEAKKREGARGYAGEHSWMG